MIECIQAEFDQEQHISMTHDLIRYMTRMSYFVPRPRDRLYSVWWPALSGLG